MFGGMAASLSPSHQLAEYWHWSTDWCSCLADLCCHFQTHVSDIVIIKTSWHVQWKSITNRINSPLMLCYPLLISGCFDIPRYLTPQWSCCFVLLCSPIHCWGGSKKRYLSNQFNPGNVRQGPGSQREAADADSGTLHLTLISTIQ